MNQSILKELSGRSETFKNVVFAPTRVIPDGFELIGDKTFRSSPLKIQERAWRYSMFVKKENPVSLDSLRSILSGPTLVEETFRE